MGSFAERMVALEVSLGDRRVTPISPAGRTVATGDAEAAGRTVERDHAASWTTFLSYVDEKGEPSARRFTCHAITGFEGATHVTGYCHERRAPRTFRVDRIRELACAETGEVFDAATHFELLRELGALRCEDKVMAHVARVMVFLARCDGEYHPLERTMLEDQLHRYCVRFNGTECMAEDVLTEVGRLAPDAVDMSKAMRALARSPGGARVARFVLDAGAAMIDADGRHAPPETRWAIEMSDVLKAIGDGRVH